MMPLVLLLLLLLAPAGAVELRLVPIEGAPEPGAEVPLELVVLDRGVPVSGPEPAIEAIDGEITARLGEHAPGRWGLRYRAPASPGEDRLRVVLGELQREVVLPVAPLRPPGLDISGRPGGPTGRPVEIRVSGEVPSLDTLELISPEGRVQSRSAREGATILSWEPGPEPFPRAVPVALRDRSRPDRPPAWGVIRLWARPRIPVQTEPGAQVSLRIGGRRYGPFVAGEDGLALATAEVRPGETSAEVLVEDELGNQHRSVVALGGDQRPSMVAAVRPAGPGSAWSALVELYAVDGRGEPWGGGAPTCLSSVGSPATATAVGPGWWRVSVPSPPDDAFFDVRIDCQLLQHARISVRVPVQSQKPARLEVRAWPPELSAEVPRAQLQAFLESPTGERLSARGISLSADRGEVLPDEPDPAALRAEYRGEAALAAGRDIIRASWRPEPGQPPLRGLELAARWPAAGDAVLLRGRALDPAGRPLAGQLLRFSIGGEEAEVETDSSGWGAIELDYPGQGPVELRVQAGNFQRRHLLFPGETLGPLPGTPDLETTLEIPIRSGRVRSVFLSTEPRTVEAIPGAVARVLVRLVDASGNPVADEDVELHASEGVVTRPRRRADGSYEATWAPPPNLSYGTVRITASSRAGTFAETSTELELVPRVVRRAPAVGVGWLAGQSGLSSPLLSAQGELHLPWLGERLYGRLSVGFYGEQIESVDEVNGARLRMDLDLLPIGLGILARQDRGRLAGWFGASILGVPYWLEARFGDQVPTRGLSLAPPGFSAYTGGGWRLRGSELTLELGYLFVTMAARDVGWQGSVGGATASVGYKVLY